MNKPTPPSILPQLLLVWLLEVLAWLAIAAAPTLFGLVCGGLLAALFELPVLLYVCGGVGMGLGIVVAELIRRRFGATRKRTPNTQRDMSADSTSVTTLKI